MEDTIVGVATAAGEGGVAIVRVSGPEAVRLDEISPRRGVIKPKPGSILTFEGDDVRPYISGVAL